MRFDSALLFVGLIAMTPIPAHAQNSAPPSAARLTRFESWQPETSLDAQVRASAVHPITRSSQERRHAVVGGLIGAVGGVAVCTIISNLADDSAGGFSTCTLKGYLLTGAAGFVLGFAVGWLI